jgi:hypothetical protein
MNRIVLQRNITTVTIVLFLMFFGFFQYTKPAFLYDQNGALRQFGIGYRSKTIIPMWLLSIVLAILSYLLVLYYINLPNIY